MQAAHRRAPRLFVRTLALLALVAGIWIGAWGKTPQEQAPAKGPEGTWKGTLGSGSAKLRLVLTITKSKDGSLGAILESIDQGATIPVDKVTVTGDALRFEIAVIGGVYEGVLNKEGTGLTGKWTQQGTTQPLDFELSPAEAAAPTPKAPGQPAAKPLTVPVDAQVPKPPIAFQAGGQTHLVYELHLTNLSGQECALVRVEALDAKDKKVLTQMEGTDLVLAVGRPGLTGAAGAEKLRVAAGMRAVIYIWVTLEKAGDVLPALVHRVTMKVGDYAEPLAVECARISPQSSVAVLGPPLRGGEWMAANGPSNTSGHRRAMIPIDGRAAIAQRFAIDWVQMREDGKTFTGDALDNKNYRAYGSEALAVADGTVAAVKDGIPENIPGAQSRAVPITLETVAGNHVILDLGQGRYAFYAHIQPGSLRVKLGDKVRRGQVLGLVGNSGNSTEPHLHFHLSDANSPLGSEGIPYLLESFELQGKAKDWSSNGAKPAPEKRRMEIPREGEVIRFLEN